MTKPRAPRTRPASDKRLPKATLLERLQPPNPRQDIEELRDRLDHIGGIVTDTAHRLAKVEGSVGYWHGVETRVKALEEEPGPSSGVASDAGEMVWHHLLFWFVVNDALLAGVYAYWQKYGLHLPQF